MELVDILDANGNAIGKTLPKKEAHRSGLHHASAHVWLYTNNGEVVIQLRAATKQNFPNLWDVSVAGHVSAGETILQAAQRETFEELGIEIPKTHFQKITKLYIEFKHADHYHDREFITVFACQIPFKSLKLQIQQEEVAAVTTISFSQLQTELADNELAKKYVPFTKTYQKEVFPKLKALFS